MMIIKLILLATVIEVTLGSNVGQLSTPSPLTATTTTALDIAQIAKQVHMAFKEKELITPTSHYRYGYEIHDPHTGTNISHYEIRYTDVTLGTYTQVNANGGRSSFNYTVDAAQGYRPTLSVNTPRQEHDVTLDYTSLASPLASATPPIDEPVDFHRFSVDEREKIDKYSPHTEYGYRTHVNFHYHLNVLPEFQYSFGYEVEETETRSQYERYNRGVGDGRITRVNADGCVSSVDYTVDAANFTVSTVHVYRKRDISDIYLNHQYEALLKQIALSSNKCDIVSK